MTTSGAPTVCSTKTAKRWTTSATSAAAIPDRIHRGGGFTILELLVVLGIVVALFGLTLPFMVDGLDRRRAETARDRIAALISQARSTARSDAVAIAIVCAEGGDRLTARRFDPDAGSLSTDGDDIESEIDPVDVGERDERAILETWATLPLDSGIRCFEVPERGFADDAAADDVVRLLDGSPPSESREVGWGSETRLLVILPDGYTIQLRPFMVGNLDRALEGVVDPLTGRISWGSLVDDSIPIPEQTGTDDALFGSEDRRSPALTNTPDEGAMP